LNQGCLTLFRQAAYTVLSLGEEASTQFKYFSSAPVSILADGTTYIYRHDGSTIAVGTLNFAPSVVPPDFISPFSKG